MPKHRRVELAACLLWAGFMPFASGQEAPPGGRGDEVAEVAKSPLQALEELIDSARTKVNAARARLDRAEGEAEKAEAAAALDVAEEKLADLEGDFQSIATGIDIESFGLRPRKEFDLGAEAQELLRPIFDELKEATARPRELEALRTDVEFYERQRDVSRVALKNLDAAIAAASDPEVLVELNRTRVEWEQIRRNAENQLRVREAQLEQGLSEQKSIFDTVTDGFAAFFRSRGMNLLATLATFVLAYLLLRFLGGWLVRYSPWHRPGKRSFYSRLVEVAYNVFCVVGAGLVALLVLYASGDWVLIGLTILFLFGLALAAKGALPKFYEQGRLLLNLGEVREGERVVIDGIPWMVESLGVFTSMRNPMLEGGELRLPIRNLPDYQSRPFEDKEPWFPCRQNEWVSLSDGTRGKVIQQTPETVHMVLLGGSRKAYPTPDFLAAAPEVLSRGFRVRSVFGLDYRHQAIATTEVPGILVEAVTRDLLEVVEREQIGRIKVEFREAGSSSLDYEIIADMKGEVADKFEVIRRVLQKACVDACNERGWTIPFPQLTLHQAGGVAALPSEATPGDGGEAPDE